MWERRKKGLCYNCEEKWSHTHKCKAPKLYILLGTEIFAEDRTEKIFYDTSDKVEPLSEPIILKMLEPEISLNAISGSLNAKTMQVVGIIKDQRVVILIDSGSTHNFIDSSVVNKGSLGLILPPHL
jgi:hypothetical protein